MDRGGGPIAVLLVDDEPDVAEVTALHLQRQNDDFEVTIEYGDEDALDALHGDIDCVVSDYEMPHKDGLDLLRDVRDRHPDLPFILFTGRGSEEIASEAISAGVTDYLQKETGTDQYAVLANRLENAVARRRSEAAATETLERYQTLVESSPNPILVHSGADVLFVNDRLVELVGAETEAVVVDHDPLDLVHPEDRERLATRVEAILDGEGLTDWTEWRLRRFDGETRWVESRGAAIVYDGEPASQVVLRDVTERHRRERRLERLHDAARELQTAPDRKAVADCTVEMLRDVLGQDAVGFWYYDGSDLRILSATDAARERVRAVDTDSDRIATLPEWSVEYTTFEGERPRVVTDYADRDDGITDAFETAYLVPLDDHGLLAVASPDPYTVAPAEQEIVGILARTVVAALDRLGRGR